MRVRSGDARKNIGEVDKRPCFFKIMWPNNLFDLQIPPAFKEHISNETSDKATLRTPNGTWEIGLCRDGNRTYLARGWPEFVKDHSLGDLEFLVFKHNGNMSFDVVIHDKLTGRSRSHPTQASRDQTAAASFTSPFPNFTYELKSHNVGSKCNVTIPKVFWLEHIGISKPKIMFLKNLGGTCTTVRVDFYTRYKYPTIVRGWKAFADDNELKQGDICGFELLHRDTFQVRKLN